MINRALTEIKPIYILDKQNNQEIENLQTKTVVRLHLQFEKTKELCIKYEDVPFLEKIPAGSRVIKAKEREKIKATFGANYVLSIGLETNEREINLDVKKVTDKGPVYPITLFYFKSAIEKFDMDYPYTVIRFNCCHTDLNPQREELSLKVTLATVDSTISYQGSIPVSFRVNIIIVLLILIKQNRRTEKRKVETPENTGPSKRKPSEVQDITIYV